MNQRSITKGLDIIFKKLVNKNIEKQRSKTDKKVSKMRN